jgi:hypothetical protein
MWSSVYNVKSLHHSECERSIGSRVINMCFPSKDKDSIIRDGGDILAYRLFSNGVEK